MLDKRVVVKIDVREGKRQKDREKAIDRETETEIVRGTGRESVLTGCCSSDRDSARSACIGSYHRSPGPCSGGLFGV